MIPPWIFFMFDSTLVDHHLKGSALVSVVRLQSISSEASCEKRDHFLDGVVRSPFPVTGLFFRYWLKYVSSAYKVNLFRIRFRWAAVTDELTWPGLMCSTRSSRILMLPTCSHSQHFTHWRLVSSLLVWFRTQRVPSKHLFWTCWFPKLVM